MKKIVALCMTFGFLFAHININTASKEQLMKLEGIGESKANAIIEYRQKQKFNTVDEIQKVDGIGPKVYERIKKYIDVKDHHHDHNKREEGKKDGHLRKHEEHPKH